MPDKRLYLIDATAFCYRAFYALKGLATSFGQPTNAVYGFITMLNKILKEKEPELIAVCFDVSRDTVRKEKFKEYKMQRPAMPDDLASQIPLIKEIISAYGIAIFEKEGYEADDIIATLTQKAKARKLATTIVSSDKDILQLVDDDVLVLSPYKDKGVVYDRKAVEERFGIEPRKITDLIALMGDAVDNIPGVPGIGEKTAVELIKNFGSLEKLLDNIEGIGQAKIKQSIRDNIDRIKLNMELAVLDKNLDLDFGWEELKIDTANYQELFRLFKSLEFKAFLKDLPVTQERPQAQEREIVKLGDRQLEEAMAGQDTVVLYGTNSGDLAFSVQDKILRTGARGENLEKLLSDPEIKKVSHDFKKIKVALAKEGIILEGLHFDTMIAAYLVNPSRSGYSLQDLSWDYLGLALSPGAMDVPQALNVINKLLPKLEEELRARRLSELFTDIEMPLIEVLTQMELTGIKIDVGALNELSRDLEKRLIKLIEDIYELSGCQFNINSPKQLRDILFARLKLPVIKKSKTGPSTDEEVLRKLSDKHKLPALLLEYRQLTKLKSTYIDALPELVDAKTGRIHTSFNQTGTETGRLSSRQPNLQNIPIRTDLGRSIRRAVVAFSKDSCLLSCDYSQIELRILAHISKDKNLITAFKNDKDIHKATAALIYGIDEKEVSDSMREMAKRVNFGIIYGLTSFGLSRDLGITPDEAQSFIDAYFLRYPGVKDYIQAQIRQAKEEGFVTTILGRRRYFAEIHNKNQAIRQVAERQAINAPIQGSASDMIKLAMVQIQRRIKELELKARMILQVHDELVFDVPEGEMEAFAGLVKDRMENVLTLEVPVKVEMKKGKNWLEMEEIR